MLPSRSFIASSGSLSGRSSLDVGNRCGNVEPVCRCKATARDRSCNTPRHYLSETQRRSVRASRCRRGTSVTYVPRRKRQVAYCVRRRLRVQRPGHATTFRDLFPRPQGNRSGQVVFRCGPPRSGPPVGQGADGPSPVLIAQDTQCRGLDRLSLLPLSVWASRWWRYAWWVVATSSSMGVANSSDNRRYANVPSPSTTGRTCSSTASTSVNTVSS